MDNGAFISPNRTAEITIGDLKDNYFENVPISEEQVVALKEFDKYKVNKLRDIEDDTQFQKAYFDIQIIENTLDYREFLKRIDSL